MDNLVNTYRAASVALNTYFCNGYSGRSKTDPVYQYVVEGRDIPAMYTKYSSCGDRAAAVLFRLGCREKWVNRNENKGWHVGANISSLAFGPSFSKTPDPSWAPGVGDEMLIWNSQSGADAHSLAIVDYSKEKSVAVTANFGSSGMSAATFPGSKFSDSPLSFDPVKKAWFCGKRQVQRVLKFEDVVTTLKVKPNLCYLDGDLLPDMSREMDELMALVPQLWSAT